MTCQFGGCFQYAIFRASQQINAATAARLSVWPLHRLLDLYLQSKTLYNTNVILLSLELKDMTLVTMIYKITF